MEGLAEVRQKEGREAREQGEVREERVVHEEQYLVHFPSHLRQIERAVSLFGVR